MFAFVLTPEFQNSQTLSAACKFVQLYLLGLKFSMSMFFLQLSLNLKPLLKLGISEKINCFA